MIKLFNNSIYKQILRFLIVGGIATIIDWLFYYIFLKCNITPYIANVLSFCIAVIFNYYASAKWVFNSNKNTFVLFIVFSIIGLLLTELLLMVFIEYLNINEMISKIISTIIVMMFNFVTRKKFM